jgi:hypothetical protein
LTDCLILLAAYKALNISPWCPDAYSALAVCCAPNHETALMLYEMAEFAGRRMVQKSFLAECYAKEDIWLPYVLLASSSSLPLQHFSLFQS